MVVKDIPLLKVPAVETGVDCNPTTLGSKVNLRSYPVTLSPVVSPIVIGSVKLVSEAPTMALGSVTGIAGAPQGAKTDPMVPR